MFKCYYADIIGLIISYWIVMEYLNTKVVVRSILIVGLLILVMMSTLGEKVAYNNGVGWDGQWYFAVCQDFLHNIFNHTYDTYRIQRILPFAIINIVLTILGIEPTIANCTLCISAMNFCMIALGVFMFIKISDQLKLKLPIEIIGFSALFLNYPILKLNGYYPFLTDTFAISIAICLLYFFLSQKKVPITLIIIGGFVWPTLLMMGLVLAHMPSKAMIQSAPMTKKDKQELRLIKCLLMAFIPLGYLIFWVALFYIKHINIQKTYNGEPFANLYMLAISLICIVLYFGYMLKTIQFSPRQQIKAFITLLERNNLIAFTLTVLCTHMFINYLSNGKSLVSIWQMIALRLIVPPTTDPLVFIVTSFMYYGPCMLFLLFYWKGVLNVVYTFGYSYFMLVILGLIMSVNTESRHMITFVPMLMIPLLKYMNESLSEKINLSQSLSFLTCSLLISRFWYKINVPGIESAFAQNVLTQFPAQRYFMSHGPWMSHTMYLVFLLVTVATSVFFLLSHKYFAIKNIHSALFG